MSVCRFMQNICKIDFFLAVPTVAGRAVYLSVIRVFQIHHIDGVPVIFADSGGLQEICDVEELGTLVGLGYIDGREPMEFVIDAHSYAETSL
jgi:hypothetical protein